MRVNGRGGIKLCGLVSCEVVLRVYGRFELK
jgi:hypothetical protein